MAAPNILGSTSVVGISTFRSGISTTSGTVILSNASNSNSVYKINSILASNTAANSATISVKIFNAAAGAGSSVSIASTILVNSGSTLVIIGKDTPIYLEENRSITAIAGVAGTNITNAIDIVASYEVIS